MRIIAGEYRSRPLKAVPGQSTRPTTDKIKEAMFNLIGPDLGKCQLALDFYAGSGALGIEAVSRGVDHAVLCEKSDRALRVISENIQMTNEPDRFTVLGGPNRKRLSQWFLSGEEGFDLVFLDPPYKQADLSGDILWLSQEGMLVDGCVIVCESDTGHVVPDQMDQLVLYKQRQYGMSIVSLYHYQARGE